MTADRKIDSLVASQYGVLSRAQALAAGMSAAAIGRRLASGAWVRRLPGVFRIASVPPSWHQKLVAAWLWGGSGAVVSHRAAVVLIGLGRFKSTACELWIPRARQTPDKSITLHFTAGIPEMDLRKWGPLLLTNPTRTLIDLGAVVDPAVVETCLDDALHRGLTSIARLVRRLDEIGGPGRRGSGVLKDLLIARDPGSAPAHSALEVRAIRALREARLPRPVRQHPVHGDDFSIHIDLAYPVSRLAIECDGKEFHFGTGSWWSDRQRDNSLNLLGWTVIRVTWDDVKSGRFVELVCEFLLKSDSLSERNLNKTGRYDRPSVSREEKRWKA